MCMTAIGQSQFRRYTADPLAFVALTESIVTASEYHYPQDRVQDILHRALALAAAVRATTQDTLDHDSAVLGKADLVRAYTAYLRDVAARIVWPTHKLAETELSMLSYPFTLTWHYQLALIMDAPERHVLSVSLVPRDCSCRAHYGQAHV